MGADGRRHTLTRGGATSILRPAPSEALLAVCEYPVGGGSSIVVLDAQDGSRLQVFKAPDGMQLLEPVWLGGELYSTALTDGGYCICRIPDFSCVLGPQPVKIRQIQARGGSLLFTSDLSGVNELYEFNPADGSLIQLTSTRFGAADFRFSTDGSTLYYTSLSSDGRTVCSTPADSLVRRRADFSRLPEYPFTEELAAGEPQKTFDLEAAADSLLQGISAPRRYSKLGNLFRFHSWMPLYVDYDAVSSLSLSSLSSAASLGATAFFQNDLGDFWGSAAYKAGYSRSNGWRHSGHLNFSWSGWYPVVEAKLHFNEREAFNYFEQENGLTYAGAGAPLFNASIDIYVPLSFSRGGWNGGLIPEVSIAATNDGFVGEDGSRRYMSRMSRMSAGLRGYLMEATPSSRIYPRWGVGAELGSQRTSRAALSALPQFLFISLRLCAGRLADPRPAPVGHVQRLISTGPYCEALMVTAPRGFETASSSALSVFPGRMKLSADYAMPLLPLDWSGLCPLAYVRNFELTLHGDLSLVSTGASPQEAAAGSLFSAGADFSVRLGNLLWLPYDTRIGVSWNYKGGSLFSALQAAGYEKSRHSISLIFSVDVEKGRTRQVSIFYYLCQIGNLKPDIEKMEKRKIPGRSSGGQRTGSPYGSASL